MSRFACPVCGKADWGFTGRSALDYAGRLRDRGVLRGVSGSMSASGPYTTTSATCRSCGYRAKDEDTVLTAINRETLRW